MPIYEYRCPFCQHQFEILQKVSDAEKTQCPNCHKEGLEKIVFAPKFQLKGTGWYETDFKNKNTKPSDDNSSDKSKNKSESKSENGSDSEKKSCTKPECKSGNCS